MAASSRGSKTAALLIRSSRQPRVCIECVNHLPSRLSLQRRNYAAQASSFTPETTAAISEIHNIVNQKPVASSSTSSQYITKAGIVISRPPLLTKPLTSFEKAFFFYQKRLNERLVMPFTRYFYFKKDTPADADWKVKARERNGVPQRELGGYNPYSEDGWNDEILEKEGFMTEPKVVQEKLVRDAIVRAVEGKDGIAVEVGEAEAAQQMELPESRYTEHDKKKDVKRLDRRLERTLYLVVKRASGFWSFPSGSLVGRENLHQAAERIIVQSAGLNMNTWVVGRVPIGHHINKPYVNKEDSSASRPGERTFFLKARILAGQADLKSNEFGLADFQWLTKQEVQKAVSAKYWSSIKDMLSDR